MSKNELQTIKEFFVQQFINPAIEQTAATEQVWCYDDNEPTYTAADILAGMSDELRKLPGDSFSEWYSNLIDRLYMLPPLDNIQRCMSWVSNKSDKLEKVKQQLPQELSLIDVADLIEYLFGQKPKQLLYCGTRAKAPLKQVSQHILPDFLRMMMQVEANYYRNLSENPNKANRKFADNIPLLFSLDDDDLLSRIIPAINDFNEPDKRPQSPYQLAQIYIRIADEALSYSYQALIIRRKASFEILDVIMSKFIDKIDEDEKDDGR